jgi:putative ABC transport system permease protein
MNLIRLSWKNITFKPLNSLLSILLFALGIGLISLLLLLQKQLQENFENNLAGVDLVVGAKGSPLQLILCSMYHVDAPTGNISLAEARPFLNPKHPIVEEAIPLSLGDNYRDYRIVGTTQNILDWYGAAIATGEVWQRNFEVTIGAQVASDLEMQIGSEFNSSHGMVTSEEIDHSHDQTFTVVGILKPTGTVIDQLILTTPQSFWLVHDHEEEEEVAETEEDHDHEGHDHEGHDHHDHGTHEIPPSLLDEPGEKEITSLLIRFKGRNYQALNMQRNINENTDLQAATPAIEVNRIFSQFNRAEKMLRILAIIIVIVSGLSIFISLFSSLRERRYELALLRVMGASRGKLFALIVLEGLLLAFVGYLAGILLAHGGVQLIGLLLKDSYRYSFSGLEFLWQEGVLLVGALLIGFFASAIPAFQAAETDISDTLAKG